MRRAAPSSKLSWILAALTAVVTVGLYAPTLGRGFVSEDFLILRCFYQAQEAGQFWATAWQSFTGPWLGLSIVSFFRPLSSLLLQLEWALFGTFSAGYGLVHLAIHLVNAWQVKHLVRLVRSSETGSVATGADSSGEVASTADSPLETAIPFAAAGIFALYPLHPNTVVFIASFATLFAVSLLLLSLRTFVEGKTRSSLLAFVAALASYEQAAILPAYLLAYEILRGRTSPRLDPWDGLENGLGEDLRRGRLGQTLSRRHLPFWLALGVYLALRQALLGHSIGGYPTFRERLGDPGALLEAMLNSLGRIVFPFYGISVGGMSLAVAAFGLWALLRWVLGRHTHGETLALVGLSWILISLAPFSFVGVVPGNGRYWYLASCGLALFWCASIQTVVSRLKLARPAAWLVLGLLAVNAFYASLLWPMSRLYREAGETTSQIQNALRQEGDGLLFVADVPRFLKVHGVPAAQVFHWGLSDAMMPPFSPHSDRQTLPLPPLGDQALASLTVLAESRVLRWVGENAIPIAGPLPDELPLRRSRDSETSPISVLDPSPGVEYRLVVITRGSYHLEDLPVDPAKSSAIEVYLPQQLVESMRHLYGEDSSILWWIEQRQESDGRLEAVSRPTKLRPSA